MGHGWGLRTATIDLLDSDLHKVLTLATVRESRILSHYSKNAWHVPTNGTISALVTLPASVPTGEYHLKYTSAWTVMGEGEIQQTSPAFNITH